MENLRPKAYKLYPAIQNYEWGMKGESAIIPKLLGIESEKDLPYAELWIGAHPKAPSEIFLSDKRIGLDELISRYPAEILGNRIYTKFGTKLPYLLKVLSSRRALSIQAHPDKELAKILHRKNPANYPDTNHKPEIAIAIDRLNAIAGFKPYSQIKETINKYSILKELLNIDSTNKFDLKNIYSIIMRINSGMLKRVIDDIRQTISEGENSSIGEKEFLIQFENYGYDVGLISILLYNYIELKEGEAIFTGAGVPHAYLRGNIIECMANSDNVVRAGLTNKFKDIDTLVEMLNYKMEEIPVTKRNDLGEFTYSVPTDEFRIININGDYFKNFNNNESIITGFILAGEIGITSKDNEMNQITFSKGESFIIPAIMKNFVITSSAGANYFLVQVP